MDWLRKRLRAWLGIEEIEQEAHTGLRWVPVEPTAKMLRASRRATNEITTDEWRSFKGKKETTEKQDFKARRRWAAMVAASPNPRF